MKRKKVNIPVILLIIFFITTVFMSVSYAFLYQSLEVDGVSTLKADWIISITGIELVSSDHITEKELPSFEDNTATFNISLDHPESYAIYSIKVENKGTINAKLKEVVGLEEVNPIDPIQIKYTITEPSDTILEVNHSHTFLLKIERKDLEDNEIPVNKSKTAKINFNYIQK